MERDQKLKIRNKCALIRIKCLDEVKFCNINLTNLTKKSFLRDGKRIRIFIRGNIKIVWFNW